MSLIICICDFWRKKEYFTIERKTNEITTTHSFRKCVQKIDKSYQTLPQPATCKLKRLRLAIDGIWVFYVLREIKQFTEFRKSLCLNSALHDLDILWIEIIPPNKEIIDYKWNHMVAHSLWEQIEIEHLMSWLSTLGGGFSALGEQFTNCAETAGKISLRQLSIGLRLGDPFLQARCKLFYSLSLIQTGRLRAAKHLIRGQYEFARLHKETDSRLVKMCKGIWLRLQYEYGLRLEKKRKQKITGDVNGF